MLVITAEPGMAGAGVGVLGSLEGAELGLGGRVSLGVDGLGLAAGLAVLESLARSSLGRLLTLTW
jgi:hypothetical protein